MTRNPLIDNRSDYDWLREELMIEVIENNSGKYNFFRDLEGFDDDDELADAAGYKNFNHFIFEYMQENKLNISDLLKG